MDKGGRSFGKVVSDLSGGYHCCRQDLSAVKKATDLGNDTFIMSNMEKDKKIHFTV